MEMNRETLVPRISLTLRAKQFLVFYAVALFTVDFATPIATGWMRRRQPLSDLLSALPSPLGDLARGPVFPIALVLAGSLALTAWFRAGYIRSIVGSLHLAPQGGRQFASLLGLLIITDGIYWGADLGFAALTSHAGLPTLLYFGLLAVGLVLLYADYAVVISGLDPLGGIKRSWQTLRATWWWSLFILFTATVLTNLVGALIDSRLRGSFVDMLPLLVARTVVLGGVTFVADVALIIVYIEALERGLVRPKTAPRIHPE
jgi:hypothetical protein